MDSISAFVPIDRRIALFKGEELPDRARGAVLFADISGFTVLTSVMAEEYGPQRGAEEIAGWLNRVFGALIRCVHNQKGSVISFNGDAITCWFDDQPAGKVISGVSGSVRAVACAFAMQETITQFRSIRLSAEKTTTLHIKVAVAAGPVRRFDIGRAGLQRIDVLAGDLLQRINIAEGLMAQDEIIVGEEVAAELESHLTIETWRLGANGQRFALVNSFGLSIPDAPWDETPFLADEVAGEWLCSPISERLDMAQGAFLAELRPSIVVLYLSFSGIDYDNDEQAPELLDRFVNWVQAILSRYEGLLLQLTIGDKGSYLLATFGAILAHEDDVARALESALAMQSLPSDLAFISDVKIGISRGPLYAGAFGGPIRQTYGVLGREANVGARLMSAAEPQQTVVSASIANSASSRYEFEELGWFPLKGVAEPRQLFAYLGKRRRGLELGTLTPDDEPIVGRSEEQAILSSKLTALTAGQSATVIIEGDPGIGKSKLTMTFLDHARFSGLPIFIGSGDDIEQGTPYYAWRPVYRALFEFKESHDPEAYQRHILDMLPDDAEIQQLAPLLNSVLPTNYPDNDLTENMAGEARAASTRNLLVALLTRAAADAPGLILVLEDAHWLDSASWALAAQVRQAMSPLLLVIVTRPMVETALQAKEVDTLLSDPVATRINLSALSSAEIMSLVWRRLGVTNLPQPIADLILRQGEGHPFYSEEIAYALRDTGYLVVENGQARLAEQATSLEDVDFPDTIQGVITSRIDQLGASEQLTLKVASVIGRIFAFHVLRSIYPEQSITVALPDHLNKLEHLDITALQAPEPELAYFFKHIITQEVVYNLMTFSQRQGLHRSAAEWYETHYADDLGPFYPLLAYHWRRAEETERAIEYLEKAGRRALRDNANREAIGFFSEIRELAASSNLKYSTLAQATWTRQIADGYLGLGDIMTARTHYEEAAGLLDRPIPTSSATLVTALLGELGKQSLHRLWPARFTNRTADAEALLESARDYHGLGFIYYVSNEILPFVHATLKALNLAEPAGLSRPLAEGYATLCVIAALLPGDRLPELYAGKAMSAAEQLDEPSILGNVTIRIAVYHSGRGHWERAEEAADQAIAQYAGINDLRGWGDSVNVKLYTLYYTGRFEECLNLAQELYQSAQRNENIQHQAWGLWMSGKSLIRRGKYEDAIAFLEQAVAANELETMYINSSLALANLNLGRTEAALEFIRRVNSETSPGFATLAGTTNIAEIYLLAWEEAANGGLDPALLPEIKDGARQVCKVLTGFSRIFPIGKPATHLYQGNLQWLEGKTDKALKSWQNAIRSAQQMAMAYELARAHYEIGRHLPAGDPQRQEHLNAAASGFEALGAGGYLARAQAIPQTL